MNLLAILFIIVIALAVIAGVCMFLAPVPQFKWFVPPVQKPAQDNYLWTCTKEDAMSYYNHMPDKRVGFFEAFGEGLIDA